ncbi:Two-pore potassium channel 3 [Raphanus sativus]|uniref:Two-pore potassium channel 3-like n=1 Tax=Raphanus sativus TaxID=3726 RepID=A0A9W3DJ70_RAPSA|nr:two-pore potassium channel 3-like [Raphanus sativus]KAJ4901538.1 Two-pore potassium channel 3 [Raphanus sativus]
MANDGSDSNVTNPLLQPEHNDVAVPMPMTPSEFKDRLIFGPYNPSSFADVLSENLSPPSSPITINPRSTRRRFVRSKSAPSVAAIVNDQPRPEYHKRSLSVALLIVYLAVMSVATVVYGKQALKTLPDWLLASIWVFVSTLAVALAFLYLAEAIRDKRRREWQNRVLAHMSISDFFAADIENTGYLSISEYVIYKLTQIGEISVEDIKRISDQFDKIDRANSGKITLADIIGSSTDDLSTATSA